MPAAQHSVLPRARAFPPADRSPRGARDAPLPALSLSLRSESRRARARSDRAARAVRARALQNNDAPAIEALLRAYARPVRVRDLPHPPHEELEDKLGVAEALFREGFLYALEDGEEESEEEEDDERNDENATAPSW